MLDLSNITILSINCIDPKESVKAIRYSSRHIKFKQAILFTHEPAEYEGIRTVVIPRLGSIHAYSNFVLRVADFKIDSDFFLFVQPDGFVLNADKWDESFLMFDYIGAAWPFENKWIQLQKTRDYMNGFFNRVGNGGFSIRSKKFVELSSKFSNCEGFSEDSFLCIIKEGYMKENGITFAPTFVADKFSKENNMINWEIPMRLEPSSVFGFHGHNFINSRDLINLKNQVLKSSP